MPKAPLALAPQAAPLAPSPQVSTPAPLAVSPQANEQAERAAPRSQPRMRTTRSEPKSATVNTPAKQGSLSAEMALLQRARRALASDPQAALTLLAQHQREHAAGVFAEEREALAVEALWRSGGAERAKQRFDALLTAYPRSTYRERLTALLARPR